MFRIVNGLPPQRDAIVHGKAFADFLSRCVAKEASTRALCAELLSACEFITMPNADRIQQLVNRITQREATNAALDIGEEGGTVILPTGTIAPTGTVVLEPSVTLPVSSTVRLGTQAIGL